MASSSSNVCTVCKEGTLESDVVGCEAIKVCSSCGAFVENSGNLVSDRQSLFEAKWASWPTKTSKAIENWIKEIGLSAKKLKLPMEMETQAKEVFRHVSRIFGAPRQRRTLAASCIYAVCKQHNVTMTLREIASAANETLYAVGRTYKLMIEAFPRYNYKPPSDFQHVERYCGEADIPNEIRGAVLTTTEKLFELMEDFGIADNYSGFLRGAACLVLAWESKDFQMRKGKKDRRSFVKIVAKRCHKAPHSLSTLCGEIRTILLSLCKRLPWMPDDISENDVKSHLDKILEFKAVLLTKLDQEEREKMPRSAAGQKRQNEVDLENERGLEELRNLKKKAKEASEGGLFTEIAETYPKKA
ncbi:uncharacterized protein [Oscarella lobularis]|uniref:uncharacterized protein isoform X2 n=1 Tax=Oscarella lobularis TaxID=121494 RepID=UPI003314454E